MYKNLNRDCLDWQRSTRSGHNGNCVESAQLPKRGGMAIRDSKQKDEPNFPMLVCSRSEWLGFLDTIKDGNLDS